MAIPTRIFLIFGPYEIYSLYCRCKQFLRLFYFLAQKKMILLLVQKVCRLLLNIKTSKKYCFTFNFP